MDCWYFTKSRPEAAFYWLALAEVGAGNDQDIKTAVRNAAKAQKQPTLMMPAASDIFRLAWAPLRSAPGTHFAGRNDPRVGTLNFCAADGPPDVSSAIAPRLASRPGGAFAFDPSGSVGSATASLI
jgi:hypothetical protein